MHKKRVTGIGGLFFKAENPKELYAWYGKHLGINADQYGSTFEWRQADHPEKKGFSQWSIFKAVSNYFTKSKKEFMINYRVEDLEWLIAELKKEGVEVTKEIESFEYGKFAHIIDPEGNAIELWEPVDTEYEKILGSVTK